MLKVAINGFGRIGRLALRIILTEHTDKLEVVAINTSGSMDVEGWAHLLQYDSVHGRFQKKVKSQNLKIKSDELGFIEVEGVRIPILAQKDPALINWASYGVDVVIEATGHFADKKGASLHLKSGAKKVVVSAEAKEVDDFVLGVNADKYEGQNIIGNASCTTNCVAPIVKIISDNFGIQKATMSTIHAYTSTQSLVDDSCSDLRRARAAGQNIIPTSTGAAKATVEVFPSLRGIFDGLAYRVPVVCGSIAEIVFVTTKRTKVEEVNQVLLQASQTDYRGIVSYTDKPLVSSDIIGNNASSIVDSKLTQVVDGDLVKVVAWYDNEWGYASRLVELVTLVGKN